MDKKQERLWLVMAAFTGLLVTYIALPGVVTSPWRVVPELGADGGKNIFTYLYHICYGHGLWFTGMNYPYGEHIVYTDAQPLLSVPLSYLKGWVTIERALAIMWWLVALSYILSVVYCFRLLRIYAVAPLMAIVFSGLITMCCPQLLRVAGHYALSYTCVLPMYFYWTVLYNQSGRWKYCAYIMVTGSLSTFLHPYYAAVALVWVGAYAFWSLFMHKGTFVARVKHVVPPVVSVGIVFVIFGAFIKFTDPVTDRPVTPSILGSVTHLKDIFTSCYSVVWQAVQRNTDFSYISTGGEGYVYTGIITLIAVGIAMLVWLIRLFRRMPGSEAGFRPIWLVVALSTLLFSMGAPFTWGMDWLLDYASLLKQFRTLARFGWVYYYVATIYAVVVMHQWYTHLASKNRTVVGPTIISAAALLWSVESIGYVQRSRAEITNGLNNYETFVSHNEKNWTQFLAEHHLTRNDFQAILILPFYETGSEKLWLCNDENISAWGVAMGIKSSMQLQLPIVDAMMSRTSWSVAFDQVKTVGGPYTDKPLLRQLKSNKPFLMLEIDNAPLDPDQLYLEEASNPIGHFLYCSAYLCYPDRIAANDRRHRDSVRPALPYCRIGQDTAIRNTGTWYVQHYNKGKTDTPFFGIAMQPYNPALQTTVCEVQLAATDTGKLYEFSCWCQLYRNDYKSPYFTIQAIDSAGNMLVEYVSHTKESVDNERSRGWWVRNSRYFTVPARTALLRCNLVDFPSASYKAIDEVMLRPASSIIISRAQNGQVMVNNHLFNQ